ncbi:alpha/beta fold hydrolase [Streptomyces hoynatensis]|uniref:Alpha/beta fold hydrolase n=1 Tax=Streptomyces hoynatensis TaxID=1141874 RepID=A0A3A9YRL0_9ACTN|nr:alpha/beta fold hydrolase [Streptomyces hoynatensis]RKN37987.1 alpha/beta fold hydrolase [Streptomyces hoynatensis]
MTRKKIGTSAAVALCCAVAGLGLVGCEDSKANSDAEPSADSSAPESGEDLLTGTRQITVGDHTVNVSCSGTQAGNRPVVVLLHGGGDDLTTMAALQETLSENGRVCSYDRLGAGASDQPEGLQDLEDIGETLTGVLDQVAGDQPVVLAGHSMGGLIAARYAPDHQDRVRGLVLMDATSPSAVADLTVRIPESVTGPAGELRAQTLAVYQGENPERLVFNDGEVRSAGDIPVQVVQHGQQYLAEVPEYGPGLEEDWTKGQQEWLAVSGNSELSTAENSGHYIYVDRPDLAVQAIERVAEEAAG